MPDGFPAPIEPTIKRGHSTTGSGIASPAAKGRVVQLQVERSGLWYTVATNHEGSGGKFSFTIKATATGTYHYRAVVHDLAGYVMYGYSPARSLRVTIARAGSTTFTPAGG